MTNVVFNRARITTPDTVLSPVRFVYIHDDDSQSGTAAAWAEVKRPPSASRVLLATGHFTQSPGNRSPNMFITDEGQEWSVIQLTGGCGCNRGQSLLASLPVEQLISPDFSSTP